MAVNPIDEARKNVKPYLPSPAPSPTGGTQPSMRGNGVDRVGPGLPPQAPSWSPADMQQRAAALATASRIASEGKAADAARRSGAGVTKTTANGVNSYSQNGAAAASTARGFSDPSQVARLNAQIDDVTVAGNARFEAARRTAGDGTPIRSGNQAGTVARGGRPMSQTQTLPTNGGVYQMSNSSGYEDSLREPDDSVGTFNGRNITKTESDFRANSLPTGNPFAEAGDGASRRSAPMQGYQAQGFAGSRAPTADDKRVLEMDLRSIGRGSPSMRAALMGRYNDSFNNAEQGQNNRADIDLAAGARSQDDFAERSQNADQFDRNMDFDYDKLGIESVIAGRNADAQGDYFKAMREDAKARREDDKYGLSRRELQDKDNRARVDRYMQANPGTSLEQASAATAADTVNSGQPLQGSDDVLGAVANEQSVLDTLGQGSSFFGDLFAGRGREAFQLSQSAPQADEYDISQVGDAKKRGSFLGLDASTLNAFTPTGVLGKFGLPISGPFDEYEAEAPTNVAGAPLRAPLRTKADADAYNRQLKLARRSQAAIDERNARARGE